MKLLLVEDHAELASNIISYLAKEGYVCEWCNSYQKAINKLSGFEYDIIMLDLMLPDGDGLDILRFIKQQNADAGVLILSAKNALDDKIQGLDLGADDYLPKPFHLSELNARLKAIYRRRNLGGAHDIIFNEISLNTDTMEVKVNDRYLDLTRKEYEMLLYMIVNKSRVLTKQSIAEHLWGDYMDSVDSFDFVYQHIKNLRKKIVQAGGRDYIQTMYGSGYKFNPNI
ncbi:response regulator transcription factor [Fulvivirga kasyanovii]|uniref:Response regulator transcription factor n=1 Tax=Fulvivirga kasyanovii TaxID=396812 RepID=A0ABW9RTX5_9BACT|nr:response regulator transcription factor [Fulvivirga kasyanovii]MTI27265.1 response regulator transcription factor [Fulvivirga kasyanovii]